MSYMWQPSGFRDGFVARPLLSYPNINDDTADDMVSLSNLGNDLNLRFQCMVKSPFVPEWIEEPFFELQILSVGTLIASYSTPFQGEPGIRIEQQLGRALFREVTVEYPPTTTWWLISRVAKVTFTSTRDKDDPLHFNRTKLHTLLSYIATRSGTS
ncbi:hypothetical protein BAE44_0021186 [Dichanthelium oligosanthes]|uniref:DUF2921 domain-containing protein n=1 Tax=Dichanthelium oligosanthes TaxID=888268 RepID=A0A1E5UYC9_9POAL|nr:hypothetical protein BAE44_0021186 [Dichanthelium oligosanthes]